jgi:hypothetical protein
MDRRHAENRTEEAEVNPRITPALRISNVERKEELVTDLQ